MKANRYEMDRCCGVLPLDKPKGCTSHDVVGKIRRLYGTQRVGHTGTLDPMATGVLVILIGRAAKAAEYITADRKCYEATLRLGLTTDSADATGALLRRFEGKLPSAAEVERAAAGLRGEIFQIPPMVSALKVGGQKLVDLQRRGITVDRAPRPVTVYRLDLTVLDEETGRYGLSVCCSGGTYIRTLCEDLGNALGCGGIMETLRRSQTGVFGLDRCVTLEQLEGMTQAEREQILLATETLFDDCPAVVLPPFFARLAKAGNEIYQAKIGRNFPLHTRVRLCDAEGFFALAEVRDFPDGSALRPIKQFRLESPEKSTRTRVCEAENETAK